MAEAIEVANAYVALIAKMPGVKREIEKSLGASDVQDTAAKGGKKAGGSFAAALGGVVKGGALAVGAAATATLGVALVKGFSRLNAIDTAEKKLTGLGHSAADVSGIMDNALAAVKGTAFGMGDAATVSASLVAANVKPGDELEGVLKSVANSAAAAGVGLGDMGSIYAKVASTGKAQNDVLMQVADRGVPIYEALADQLGVTTAEVTAMAAAGKIGFAEFQTAMTAASGTVATEMGKTLPGATSNLMASLGRIGAGLLGGIYPFLAPLVQSVTAALGPIEVKAKEIGEAIGTFVGPALQWLTDKLSSGIDFAGIFDAVTAFSPLSLIFQTLQPVLPAIVDALVQVGTVLGGALASAAQTLMPVVSELVTLFSGIVAEIVPMLLPVLVELAGVFGEVLTAVAPLVAEIISALLPAIMTLVPVLLGTLLPIFTQLIGLLLPIIQAILPVLMALFNALAPIVLQLVSAFLPLLEPILALISPLLGLVGVILPPLAELLGFVAGIIVDQLGMAIDFLLPLIMGVVNAISDYMIPIIDTLTGVIGGIVTFITGVFSGDWEKAWQGIQDVFSSIWTGVQDIAKGAINFIIDVINGAIGAINGLASGISDLTGGAISIQIPTIPKLADGGVVKARPGGILANIGEGRYDEAVVPLSPSVLGALAGGGGASVEIVGNSAPFMEWMDVYEKRSDGTRRLIFSNGKKVS